MKYIYLLKQAFLNMQRNKRRSLMVLIILGASMMIVFISNSYLEQMYKGMQLGYMYQSGAFQIAHVGFWGNSKEGDLLLDSSMVSIIESELKKDASFLRANKELGFQGLLGTEKKSTVVSGMGIETGKTGGYAGFLEVKSGTTLDTYLSEGVLIGLPIAEKLDVNVDDWASIMGTTIDGSMNLASVMVNGICSTGYSQADEYFCAANLDFIQAFRNTDGIDRLLVFLREGSRIETSVLTLRDWIDSENLPLEIKTWEDLNPMYFELKVLYDGIFSFIRIIISILVFLSVIEIVSMTFLERFRELGTLRAIGGYKSEIFLLLLFEVIFYCTIGIIIGGSAGMVLAQFLNDLNLTWVPPGATTSVPLGFYVRARSLVSPALTILVASFFAAILPAIKCANNQVVDVMNE